MRPTQRAVLVFTAGVIAALAPVLLHPRLWTVWLAYLFARAAFAANETAGSPAAGERESTFEEELRGRTIALTTFRALKHQRAEPESAYFSDIDRVEAAGFLREYVWSYLRHASWSDAP
jgi:hypothetical protein